ncbi:cation:proton antiporter [Companilactobacillus sp. DQM5]|uniref:cation:proton antiporter n=1 Tax=Companilactobacillus sp. DQM5 TaxID=3463359 RepID=UPI0040586CF6
MNNFSIVASLLLGVIGANIVKQFVPKIPEAFILTVAGIGLSFVSIFKNFELKPEFFMLIIIAPLMFNEGQKQSFNKITSNFSRIIVLSVFLSVFSAILVGIIATKVEVEWTLPLSLALAAIITPTDAVAVQSITQGTDLPKSVDDDLQLESLFNDAVGLAMLDLALSVMSKGTFSLGQGIGHFLFVSIGGIVVGLIAGYMVVMIRFVLNTRVQNPELITIPISLLTPFAVYLLAERFGVSGILAVVATGIEHNWESNRLRLTSTNVQLTSRTIWSIVTDILNDFVFLILGMALPSVWNSMKIIGVTGVIQLLGLSILIYFAMVLLRYIWSIKENENLKKKQKSFFASIFSLSGVHGTMTLAMAFSLPHRLAGKEFPYRNELILVATFVIIISMLTASIILPIILPKKEEEFSHADLEHVRNKMVDHAILQMREVVTDYDIRQTLNQQLQSQKNNMNNIDRELFTANSELLLNDTKELIYSLLQEYNGNNRYSMNTISIYEKVMQRGLSRSVRKSFKITFKEWITALRHNIKHLRKELVWHLSHRVITKKQRNDFRMKKLKNDPRYAKNVKNWDRVHSELLDLNNEIIMAVDDYLNDILQQRIEQKHADNDFVYMVRKIMDRFFNSIKHRYGIEATKVDRDVYVQVFQYEYDFVRTGVTSGHIPQSLASVLYTEINQAQLLQLYQIEE